MNLGAAPISNQAKNRISYPREIGAAFLKDVRTLILKDPSLGLKLTDLAAASFNRRGKNFVNLNILGQKIPGQNEIILRAILTQHGIPYTVFPSNRIAPYNRQKRIERLFPPINQSPDGRIAALVTHALDIAAEDYVFIRGSENSTPLLNELIERVRSLGANFYLAPFKNESFQKFKLLTLTEDELNRVSDATVLEMLGPTAFIFINSPFELNFLRGVESGKLNAESKSFKLLLAKRSRRWIGLPYPCPALAEAAGKSLEEYQKLYYATLLGNERDPLSVLQKKIAKYEKIRKILANAQTIRIIKDDETDLSFKLFKKAAPINDASWLKNLPFGEVFCLPEPGSANGKIYFDVLASLPEGPVGGITLNFKSGQVIFARAKIGDEILQSKLDLDEGAKQIGEFAIGCDQNLDASQILTPLEGFLEILVGLKDIYFDEKMLKTIHLALGRPCDEHQKYVAYTSALHLDLVKYMANGAKLLMDEKQFCWETFSLR